MKAFASTLLLISLASFVAAQQLNGPLNVLPSGGAVYSVSGPLYFSYEWEAVGGTVLYQDQSTVQILWDPTPQTGTVRYKNSSTSAYVTVNVNIRFPALSSTSVVVNYMGAGGNLSVTQLPDNLTIDEVFWEISYDNANWTYEAGGSTYSINNVTAPYYVRAIVYFDNYSYNSVTNACYVDIFPTDPGTISLSAPAYYYTVPVISGTPAIPGPCTNVIYLWTIEKLTPGSFPQFVFGGVNFPTDGPPLLEPVKVRRTAVCGSDVVNSNEVILTPIMTIDFENQSYVRESSILVPGINHYYTADALTIGNKLQVTNYLDGNGRSVQSVSKGTASSATGWQDEVNIREYDGFGKEVKHLLGYSTATALGKFKQNALNENVGFYQAKFGDNNSFGKSVYENSPLSRMVKEVMPGDNYVIPNKGISYEYELNNANEKIKVWEMGDLENDLPVTTGEYASNMLFKNVTTDDRGKMMIDYVDFEGKLILNKVQNLELGQGLDVNGYGGWISTYYVYDDFGRLRFIITPKLVNHKVSTSGVNANWQVSAFEADELCFSYFYDELSRVVVSHTPGAGKTEIVYDQRDRAIFTRTSEDAIKQRWLVKVPDHFDRDQLSGFLHNATYTRVNLQLYLRSAAIYPATFTYHTAANNGSQEKLSISFREAARPEYLASKEIVFNPGFESVNSPSETFVARIDDIPPTTQTQQLITSLNFLPPGSNLVTLAVNYYDDYSYQGVKSFSNNFSFPSSSNPYVLLPKKADRTFGYLTGQTIRVIDDEIYTNDKFLLTTNYYDEYSHMLQQLSDNYVGGVDVITDQYDFANKLLARSQRETIPGTSLQDFSIITRYDYDLIGRLTAISKNYSNSSYKKLFENKYDEFGRVSQTKLSPDYNGGSGIETLDYTYTLQGWLKAINKDYVTTTSDQQQWSRYFGQVYQYENNDIPGYNSYNGDISGTLWKSQGDNVVRRFDYQYKNTTELKSASYKQRNKPSDASWNNTKYDFSSPLMEYDVNGNIKQLQQKGLLPGQNVNSLVDDLVYTYGTDPSELSNKLTKITDNSPNTLVNGTLGDFKSNSPALNVQYAYNGDGALTKDENKVIKESANNGIYYNVIGRPYKVVVEGKCTIEYVYDAGGERLARKVTNTSVTPNLVKWEHYVNDIFLEDNVPMYFTNETGRLRVSQVSSFGFTPAPILTIGGNGGLLIDGKQAFFDYFIGDNQASTRMVLTEEEHSEYHKATMERSDTRQQDYEERMFGAVNSQGNPAANNELIATRDETPPSAWSIINSANQKATRLTTTQRVGPNTFFKVMAGDVFHTQAAYFYNQPVNNMGGNIAASVINSLVSALSTGGSAEALKNSSTAIQSQLNLDGGLTGFINTPDGCTSCGTPNAYINWLFFDENFNPVAQGAKRVGQNPDDLIAQINIKVPANGYAFFYLSNNSGITVWFDNFVVQHVRGRILQEHHYYPYGLEIANIGGKSAGKLENLSRYQGMFSGFEKETGWNNFFLRNYDPQIGRWLESDPYNQFVSPYLGMGNDPVNNIDKDGGMCAGGWGAIVGAVGFGITANIMINGYNNRMDDQGISEKRIGKWGRLGIVMGSAFLGAGLGYATGERFFTDDFHNNGTFFQNFRAFYKGFFGGTSPVYPRHNGYNDPLNVYRWSEVNPPNIWGWVGEINISLPKIFDSYYLDRWVAAGTRVVSPLDFLSSSDPNRATTPDARYSGQPVFRFDYQMHTEPGDNNDRTRTHVTPDRNVPEGTGRTITYKFTNNTTICGTNQGYIRSYVDVVGPITAPIMPTVGFILQKERLIRKKFIKIFGIRMGPKNGDLPCR